MKKGNELFEYNKSHDYGKSLNDAMTMNLFRYTAKHLQANEEAYVAFLGILYYQPSAQFPQWYGVAITNQRLMVGLNNMFNREFVAFDLHEFTGISIIETARYATLAFLHPTKNINIGVLSHRVDNIVEDIINNTSLQLVEANEQ